MHWNYLVFVVCFLLAVFTVINEYRRANKQRLGLRIAASLTAAVALAAIALPISYWTETSYVGNEAVLLTTGFNKDSLYKFKGEVLYTLDAGISKHFPNAKLVFPNELKKLNVGIARLQILGNGLTKDELNQLN